MILFKNYNKNIKIFVISPNSEGIYSVRKNKYSLQTQKMTIIKETKDPRGNKMKKSKVPKYKAYKAYKVDGIMGKRCKRCGDWHRLEEFPKKGHVCQECHQCNRKYWINGSDYLSCSCCKKIKSFDSFQNQARSLYGKQAFCRKCQVTWCRKNQQDNAYPVVYKLSLINKDGSWFYYGSTGNMMLRKFNHISDLRLNKLNGKLQDKYNEMPCKLKFEEIVRPSAIKVARELESDLISKVLNKDPRNLNSRN